MIEDASTSEFNSHTIDSHIGRAESCTPHSQAEPGNGKKTGLSESILTRYFNYLVVSPGAPEIKGMTLFFDQLYRYGLLPERVVPVFASSVETFPSKELSRPSPQYNAMVV